MTEQPKAKPAESTQRYDPTTSQTYISASFLLHAGAGRYNNRPFAEGESRGWSWCGRWLGDPDNGYSLNESPSGPMKCVSLATQPDEPSCRSIIVESASVDCRFNRFPAVFDPNASFLAFIDDCWGLRATAHVSSHPPAHSSRVFSIYRWLKLQIRPPLVLHQSSRKRRPLYSRSPGWHLSLCRLCERGHLGDGEDR